MPTQSRFRFRDFPPAFHVEVLVLHLWQSGEAPKSEHEKILGVVNPVIPVQAIFQLVKFKRRLEERSSASCRGDWRLVRQGKRARARDRARLRKGGTAARPTKCGSDGRGVFRQSLRCCRRRGSIVREEERQNTKLHPLEDIALIFMKVSREERGRNQASRWHSGT